MLSRAAQGLAGLRIAMQSLSVLSNAWQFLEGVAYISMPSQGISVLISA